MGMHFRTRGIFTEQGRIQWPASGTETRRVVFPASLRRRTMEWAKSSDGHSASSPPATNTISAGDCLNGNCGLAYFVSEGFQGGAGKALIVGHQTRRHTRRSSSGSVGTNGQGRPSSVHEDRSGQSDAIAARPDVAQDDRCRADRNDDADAWVMSRRKQGGLGTFGRPDIDDAPAAQSNEIVRRSKKMSPEEFRICLASGLRRQTIGERAQIHFHRQTVERG